MATPQPGQPPYEQPVHDSQVQEDYDASQHNDAAGQQHVPQGAPTASSAGRKKRGYAGQAYEFGGGANAAVGGQQPGGVAYPPPPGAGYGGYGQQPQPAAQTPGYGSGSASPAVGAAPGYGQQPGAVGGYQSPDPGYPAQVPHGQPPSGVGGITHGMGSLAVAGQAQQHSQGRPPMNQLYPQDLLNSALNVTDLDLPPPPIILPANVRLESSRCLLTTLTGVDRSHCLARFQLPSEIRTINFECRPYNALPAQKVKAPLCVSHTTLRLIA